MKKYLVTMIFRYARGGDTIQYQCVCARTKQAAKNKARKQVSWQFRYSLLAVDIVNVILVSDDTERELRAQIAQAERTIDNAEKFLQIAKHKYSDLRSQLWAIEN